MLSTLFLKLGGSLITEKTGLEALRLPVLNRLAGEIAQAWQNGRQIRLLLGHGSGSFGHVPAARYGTRQGVKSAAQWLGFAEVSASALRLNRFVTEALLAHDLPAISLQPAASAVCEDGHVTGLAVDPIIAALEAGLLPVIHGDVAFVSVRGGTIISTEEIMTYLVAGLRPTWLLLAGETGGVLDADKQLVPVISQANYRQLQSAIGRSRGTDVTGGMGSKVRTMLDLVGAYPQLSIRIFSGMIPGQLRQVLSSPQTPVGTLIQG
jgi:isopentenyl phosphate kinase